MFDYGQDTLIYVISLALPFCLLGSLLPIWMFVNTLQLIAHTPLINTAMPSNAHYFLMKYLNIVRLNISSVDQRVESSFGLGKVGTQSIFLNQLMQVCGYHHSFVQNLNVMILLGLVLIATWVLCVLKDYISRGSSAKFLRTRHEPMLNNITLRFFYECFFEICICIMINIAALDFGSLSSSIQWATAMIFAGSIVVFMMFLVSLAYRNGPYHPGYYQPGTFWKSIWAVRPYNSDIRNNSELKRLKRLRRKFND